MKKLAILGASILQLPLIEKTKKLGIETHVFAWECGDAGEKTADYFYPISIVDKEKILRKCQEIGIDGICSIASDLAMVTVNYVAEKMKLTGNSTLATEKSTNKFLMRQAFEAGGDPSPKSVLVDTYTDVSALNMNYPVIVKPTDRSGSRGIYKLDSPDKLKTAISLSIEQSFEKKAIIEEFVTGKEYSVEYISWQGVHWFLALTEKFTTGAPHYIETGHREPADVSENILNKIKAVVEHALDTLELRNGASHSEVIVTPEGDVEIVEIGGRMGGDFIGSDLVELSTGYDYVKAVIDVALGIKPEIPDIKEYHTAVVEFDVDDTVTDSSNRLGYRIYCDK